MLSLSVRRILARGRGDGAYVQTFTSFFSLLNAGRPPPPQRPKHARQRAQLCTLTHALEILKPHTQNPPHTRTRSALTVRLEGEMFMIYFFMILKGLTLTHFFLRSFILSSVHFIAWPWELSFFLRSLHMHYSLMML